ncbi:MAG: Acyl-CoA transferase [Acidimicrobiales bacterium]|nr:Acyl-CoA transferase [Acidimicrobiales bacterium]
MLDLANLASAPQVPAILGDFGADVVKVEPPGGDPLRGMGQQRDGQSLVFAFVNRNKRGITLDLATDDGQDEFRRLVAVADVVVENAPARVQRAWRCTWDDLHPLNPGLILASVSCYGQDGPYADRPGAGTLAEAFAGLTHMTGDADGPPMLPSVPLGDLLTGTVGALGVLAALHHRHRTGEGQHVDVSMYEPVLQLLGVTIASWHPGDPPPHRHGSRVPGGVPRNVYRTGDGQWIVVSGTTDAQVGRLLGILGLDTDDGRARFGASPARLRVADELDSLVARWIADRDRDDVLATLLDARIPAAPVHDLAALLGDPQVQARGDVVTVDGVPMVAPAPRLGRTPGAITSSGPGLGAHNDEVRRDWLT